MIASSLLVVMLLCTRDTTALMRLWNCCASTAVRKVDELVDVEFLPMKTSATVAVGTTIEEAAKLAGVSIPFNCRKGYCGTCEVQIDKKWVRACQSTVIPAKTNSNVQVCVSPVISTEKQLDFFTPASFVEGVINNALGLLGFIQHAMRVDQEFKQRMAQEEALRKNLVARKAQQNNSS